VTISIEARQVHRAAHQQRLSTRQVQAKQRLAPRARKNRGRRSRPGRSATGAMRDEAARRPSAPPSRAKAHRSRLCHRDAAFRRSGALRLTHIGRRGAKTRYGRAARQAPDERARPSPNWFQEAPVRHALARCPIQGTQSAQKRLCARSAQVRCLRARRVARCQRWASRCPHPLPTAAKEMESTVLVL
jgi:hypothetical protein